MYDLLVNTSKTVFSTRDVENILRPNSSDSLYRSIDYYTKTSKLIQIKKGFYIIPGRNVNIFELGNKLRTPSYISFESVLAEEGVIFQWDNKITLSSKESINMEVMDTKFVFRQLKDSILLNKKGITEKDNYYIASKERALLDILYINPKFMFDNLDGINFEMCKKLLNVYNRKSLVKIIDKLEKDVREK